MIRRASGSSGGCSPSSHHFQLLVLGEGQHRVKNEVLRFDGAGGWHLVTDSSDKWEYVDGLLVYNTANLFRLMVLEMLAVPRERLKTCARPDCPHRFFVARHLKQNYCSEPCSAWGQRHWKQKWWEEHGTEWRRQQIEKGNVSRR